MPARVIRLIPFQLMTAPSWLSAIVRLSCPCRRDPAGDHQDPLAGCEGRAPIGLDSCSERKFRFIAEVRAGAGKREFADAIVREVDALVKVDVRSSDLPANFVCDLIERVDL